MLLLIVKYISTKSPATISFFFSSLFSSVVGWSTFAPTAVIQIYTVGHITYFHWKQRRQTLRQRRERQCGGDNQDIAAVIFHPYHPSPSISSSRSVYNKTLFDFTAMVVILIGMFINLIIKALFIGTLPQQQDYRNMTVLSTFVFYLYDFSLFFCTSIIIPTLLYWQNPEAIVYLQGLYLDFVWIMGQWCRRE